MVCEGGLNEIIGKELIQHACNVQSQGLGTHWLLSLSLCLTHTLTHVLMRCELFCIHLSDNTPKMWIYNAHLHMQMCSLAHLAYIHTTGCIGAHSFFLFLLHPRKQRWYFFFFSFFFFFYFGWWLCILSVCECVFCPLMCLLHRLARVPLTRVYGLIPGMCVISLTTLQHI